MSEWEINKPLGQCSGTERTIEYGEEYFAALIETEEGLQRYDFLGGPDLYKLRWTDDLRERATLRAFMGARATPSYLWWRALRPSLKAGRERVRRLRERDA